MDLRTVGFGLLLVIGAVVTWVLLRRAKRGLDSRNWPTTSGIVRASGVTIDRREDRTTHGATIVYEYRVGGTTQVGDKRSFSDYRSSSGRRAYRIVAQYPVGSRVTVYYHPRKPELSVLEPGLNWSTPLFIALGLIFIAVGLLGLLGVLG